MLSALTPFLVKHWASLAIAGAVIAVWLYVQGLAGERDRLRDTVEALEADLRRQEQRLESVEAAQGALSATLKRRASAAAETAETIGEIANETPTSTIGDSPALRGVFDRLRERAAADGTARPGDNPGGDADVQPAP